MSIHFIHVCCTHRLHQRQARCPNQQSPAAHELIFTFLTLEITPAQGNNAHSPISSVQLITPDQFQHIESRLEKILSRVQSQLHMQQLGSILSKYILTGGKRIRPQLTLWTAQLCQKSDAALFQKSDTVPSAENDAHHLDAILDLACGWELFHAFLLIHDDIIDQADMRREFPSLHRQLHGDAPANSSLGKDLAIIAGDLIFSLAMQVFHQAKIDNAQTYRRVLNCFSQVSTVTGFGQILDICQSHQPLNDVCEKTLMQGYHWKTAAYTFEGPMVTGGIMGGLDEKGLQALSEFGIALGKAYQLQNDLIDLKAPAHDGNDIAQGKRTMTLLRARQGLSLDQQVEFDVQMDQISKANGNRLLLVEDLTRQVLNSDAARLTGELVIELLEQARSASVSENLPVNLQKGLGRLLDQLSEQYFAMP